MLLSAALLGCGNDSADGEGDCTVVVTFDDVDYEGRGSGPRTLSDQQLGDATVSNCGDEEEADDESASSDTVTVWSVRDLDPGDVVGVRVENRVDLYFRNDLDQDRVDDILEDIS